MSKKLTKITDDSCIIGGVCAGMADYFGLELGIVRLLWVAAGCFSTGTAIIMYFVLALILPEHK